MATKKVHIPISSGAKASGKTVPGPGSIRGGGTTANGGKSGKMPASTGGGFGNARGVMSRGKNGKSC